MFLPSAVGDFHPGVELWMEVEGVCHGKEVGGGDAGGMWDTNFRSPELPFFNGVNIPEIF